MKYDWKKEEKHIYGVKQKPSIINLEKTKYLMIDGVGDPNKEEFQNCVKALYSLSFPIKMKNKIKYFDYTIYPLEGFWDLTEKGRKNFSKEELKYTLMIKQPKFVTDEILEKAKIYKKEIRNIDKVYLKEIEEGLVVQMMHIGTYDSEKKTFDKMIEFAKNEGYEIKSLIHKEIYLSDARKTEPNKLKTILRYKIKKCSVYK